MNDIKRFDRILHLFLYLQSRQSVSLKELSTKYGVSERTIFRDIKSLIQSGIPIINDSNKGYSLMEGFRMRPLKFTDEEMLSLYVAEKFLKENNLNKMSRYYESVFMKIKGTFLSVQKEDAHSLDSHIIIDNKSSVQIEYPVNILESLLSCILSKTSCAIDYQKLSQIEVERRTIEPIGVFSHSNLWYIYAYCRMRSDYRQFRLDRIKNISINDEPYSSTHPSLEELRQKDSSQFKTIIKISIEKKYAHYIHWDRVNYGFVSEEFNGDVVIMTFDYEYNPHYFVRWFMSYMDVGVIIEPLELKSEMQHILNNALRKFKSDP